jgi:HK97 family phage major capsid protein
VQISLTPKRISAFVQASIQAMRQANLDVEAMIRQDLLDGTAVLVENAAINGSGAGANPRGIRNVAGIGSVAGGTNGANVAWTHIVGLESAVANVNAEPDTRAGYLTNTKVRGTAKQTQKATNLQFLWDNGAQPLNGYRAAISNNVPSNLTKGTSSGVCSSILFSSDWSMLTLALFGAFDVVVDPYTQKNSGMVEIAINAYIDVGCRQPAAFASMDDALTP